MDGGQLLQRLVALGLPLDVLGGDGVQRHVGDGVARLVNHIGLAVLAHLDGGHDIIQKGLRRHKIDHAHNRGAPAPVLIEGGGHHNGQLPGNLADQGLRDIDRPRHGLLHILPVRVVLAVEDAAAVGADDVAPLKSVHLHPLVNDGPLFLRGYLIVGQLGDTACVHGYVLIGGQLLLDALRRQHGGLAHHLVHRGDCASVIQCNAGGSHQNQRRQNCRHQTYCNFFTNTLHFRTPLSVIAEPLSRY